MASNILIIDDDPEDAEILIDACKNCGIINIRHLLNAGEAFEYLDSLESKADHPKMIITDNFLPGITGTELLVKLKSAEAYRSIPVIILSASRSEKETERYREMGALDYLSKPSSYEEYARLAHFIQTKVGDIAGD